MAWIVVKRIGFDASHGVSAAEREETRRFEVDVRLKTDVRNAAATDRLADTANYASIAEIVVRTGTANTQHLIECVAGKILRSLQERFAPQDLQIELRKLAPPGCPGSPDYAAVVLTLADIQTAATAPT